MKSLPPIAASLLDGVHQALLLPLDHVADGGVVVAVAVGVDDLLGQVPDHQDDLLDPRGPGVLQAVLDQRRPHGSMPLLVARRAPGRAAAGGEDRRLHAALRERPVRRPTTISRTPASGRTRGCQPKASRARRTSQTNQRRSPKRDGSKRSSGAARGASISRRHSTARCVLGPPPV
jgi:hypothetical protein